MTSRGMFEWLFPIPELELPEDSRSFQWECFTEAPVAPPNTLEYEVDPIQELFGVTKCSIQDAMWRDYHNTMRDELILAGTMLQNGSGSSA